MAATVRLSDEAIRIGFTGLAALATRRRTLSIPMGAVRSIRTASPPTGTEDVGPVSPLSGLRAGVVRREGRVHLLAFRPGRPTMTIELDRDAYPEVRFDTLVVSVDDAGADRA